jgi:hypothetical protein
VQRPALEAGKESHEALVRCPVRCLFLRMRYSRCRGIASGLRGSLPPGSGGPRLRLDAGYRVPPRGPPRRPRQPGGSRGRDGAGDHLPRGLRRVRRLRQHLPRRRQHRPGRSGHRADPGLRAHRLRAPGLRVRRRSGPVTPTPKKG